jgi:hypothetical protein
MNCFYHPDQPRAAFCQECGKPLCSACTRPVGGAIFCDACLQARVAPPAAGIPAATYIPATPPIADPGASPFLAGVLGFIPGVGAMYNGQFVKAMVHIVVFALLCAMADHNGFFGLLIAGWVFYQVFDAIHTARARAMGDPLPDPFGITRLEGSMGFTPRTNHVPPTAQPGAPFVPPVPPADYVPPQPPPLGMPFEGTPYPQRSGMPSGAVILIAAGVLFLLNSLNIFHVSMSRILLPVFFIGLGGWLTVRKLPWLHANVSGEESVYYHAYFVRRLFWPLMLSMFGLLSLLNNLYIIRWHNSWPLYLVLAGVIMLAQRVVANQAAEHAEYPAHAETTTTVVPPPATQTNSEEESALSHRVPKEEE